MTIGTQTSLDAIQLAIDRGDHDDAIVGLKSEANLRHPADLIGIAERAGKHAQQRGDRAHARSYYLIALLGYQADAAEATSAAEAACRLLDVKRLEQLIARMS